MIRVSGFDNPSIANRRIYLIDPATGKGSRLNESLEFQDAPQWSKNGKLRYVQKQNNTVVIMEADVATQQSRPLESTRRPLPSSAGYYGQFDWEYLFAGQPEPKK